MNLAAVKPGVAGVKQILLIGKSGAGKSTLLRTMPGPIFVADFDMKGEDILGGIEGELEPYDGPDDWASFKKLIEKWEKDGCPYKTIALDSLSLAGDSIVEWAKRENGNRSHLIAPADWGRAITEVKATIRKLKKLNTNLVVTAHFTVEKDEMLGGVVWETAIFGSKLPGALPTMFNDVWLLKLVSKLDGTKTVTNRMLQLTPDQRFDMLKNSSKGRWASEEAPDFTQLMNKLNKD